MDSGEEFCCSIAQLVKLVTRLFPCELGEPVVVNKQLFKRNYMKLALKELKVNCKQFCMRWANKTREHSSKGSDPRWYSRLYLTIDIRFRKFCHEPIAAPGMLLSSKFIAYASRLYIGDIGMGRRKRKKTE